MSYINSLKRLSLLNNIVIFISVFFLNNISFAQFVEKEDFVRYLPYNQKYKPNYEAYAKRMHELFKNKIDPEFLEAFVEELVSQKKDLHDGNYIYWGWFEMETKLQKILNSIISNTKVPNRNMNVFIIKDPDINAFVFDNESIYVTIGLVANCTDEAMIAEILAHEIGHMEYDHVMQNYIHEKRSIRQAQNTAIVTSIFLGSGVATLLANGILAGHAKFSRENEKEADEFAYKTLIKLGYSPIPAENFYKLLIHEEAKQKQRMDYKKSSATFFNFDSHPASKERLEILKNKNSLLANKGTNNIFFSPEAFDSLLWTASTTFAFLLNNYDFKQPYRLGEIWKQHLYRPNDTLILSKLAQSIVELYLVRPDLQNQYFLSKYYFYPYDLSNQAYFGKYLLPEFRFNNLPKSVQNTLLTKKRPLTLNDIYNYTLQKTIELNCIDCFYYVSCATDSVKKINDFLNDRTYLLDTNSYYSRYFNYLRTQQIDTLKNSKKLVVIFESVSNEYNIDSMKYFNKVNREFEILKQKIATYYSSDSNTIVVFSNDLDDATNPLYHYITETYNHINPDDTYGRTKVTVNNSFLIKHPELYYLQREYKANRIVLIDMYEKTKNADSDWNKKTKYVFNTIYFEYISQSNKKFKQLAFSKHYNLDSQLSFVPKHLKKLEKFMKNL
ncbi:MAG: M48 family metallopeptidase [Bacteroidota bacterium]|nr:M48 family metallopeptidase [Bacteroidota bacterium]